MELLFCARTFQTRKVIFNMHVVTFLQLLFAKDRDIRIGIGKNQTDTDRNKIVYSQ